MNFDKQRLLANLESPYLLGFPIFIILYVHLCHKTIFRSITTDTDRAILLSSDPQHQADHLTQLLIPNLSTIMSAENVDEELVDYEEVRDG